MNRAVRILSLAFIAMLLILPAGCGPNDAGATIEVTSPGDRGRGGDAVGGDGSTSWTRKWNP